MPSVKNMVKFSHSGWNCHFTELTDAVLSEGDETKIQKYIMDNDIRNMNLIPTLPENMLKGKLTQVRI